VGAERPAQFRTTSQEIPTVKNWLPVVLLATAACGGNSDSVVFGAAGPWDEGYGAMNRHGIELAIEQLNASPEWRDRPIQVRFENDFGKGDSVPRIARRFVEDPEISAVIGHVNSGAMTYAVRIYEGHLPAVATTATSPALTGMSPWAFRVISSDSTNGLDMARFASRLGKRRVAILYENNSYGRGLADSFRRNFTGEIISMDPTGDGPDQTFEPYITYYQRLNPDLVFVAGTDASGRTLLAEARRAGFTTPMLGGDGWSSLSVDTVLAEGIYVGAPFSDADPRPEARAFVEAFQKRFGMTPDGNAALAYDATMLLAQAARVVGPNRKKIRDYLASLDEKDAFRGATGPIRFRPDGDPMDKSFVMTRIRNGALVVEGAQ
jgi:branched-chain amino acid transport system substrate-binding protein